MKSVYAYIQEVLSYYFVMYSKYINNDRKLSLLNPLTLNTFQETNKETWSNLATLPVPWRMQAAVP